MCQRASVLVCRCGTRFQHRRENMSRTVRFKVMFGVIAFCALAALYWYLHLSGTLKFITDQGAIFDWVNRLGASMAAAR